MAEIELKLAAVSDQLQQVRQALEAMRCDVAATTSVLTSTYYDSADLKLRKHHLSLRIREGDGKRRHPCQNQYSPTFRHHHAQDKGRWPFGGRCALRPLYRRNSGRRP